MTAGYVVADARGGGDTHPGTGQAAATTWLARLRTLARQACVTPTLYAEADLDALRRVNDPGLSATAVNTAGDIVDQILGITSVRGATLLPDGPLTNRAADLLNTNGPTVAISAAGFSPHDAGGGAAATADVAPRRVCPHLVTAPFDPAVGAALAAAGTDPMAPTYLDAALAVRLRHDSTTARRQDALGAMLWRALQPDVATRSEILLPPAAWNLQTDDAQAVLSTLATTIRSGLAVPRPLPALITAAEAVTQAPQPLDSSTTVRGRFDDDVITKMAGSLSRLWGLTSALTVDARSGLTGVQYTAPLREDMLRAVSQAERPDTRNGLAHQRLEIVGHTIDDLFGAVSIVNPGGSYTLATEHSPLPLALHNGLAVPIRVHVQVDAPPGMRVADVGEVELPPGYLPLRVPIEVNFTQRVAVDVSLRTPDGLSLGEPVRLSVHSNAYGKVLFAFTLTAAGVLVALAGRRLWHRFRGQPDPADLDRPDPGDAVILSDGHQGGPRRPHANSRVDEENRV
jgi:hypothetical protein